MSLHQSNKAKTLLSITLAIMPLTAFSQPQHEKQFGPNAPFQIADLPVGNVRSKLDRLPDVHKQKALKWLHGFSFTEQDLKYLQVDDEGGVFYSDSYLPDEGSAATLSTIEQPQAISASDAFILHSKPGSKNVVYLDFDGHVITSTAWNSYVGIATLNAKAFDTDGNPGSFGATELSQIAEIWHRVAEDYAPFDVDVTTELPGTFGPKVGRILITQDLDANGNKMPAYGAGGVAYVNVWGASNYASYYSPALVYYNKLGPGYAPYIAEAAAHEMGHNLGLSHDAYNDGTTALGYYQGQGSGFVSWAPIMGVGYYTNVTQWSKGEYLYATNFEDDINVISTKLTYRIDDNGNDRLTSSSLLVDAAGTITASNPETDPHNTNPNNKGIIETSTDVDYFGFDTGTGSININVTPAWEAFYRTSTRGANLDIQVTLYDQNGVPVAQNPNDPLDETDAVISATVPAGHYYLAIRGTGNSVTPYSNYGSLGQYFISGTVVPGTFTDTTPPNPNPMSFSVAPYAVTGSNSISMTASTAADPSGGIQYHFHCTAGGSGCVDSPWQTSSSYTATGLQSSTTYSFQVQAKDSLGNINSYSTAMSATTVAALPAAPVNLTGSKSSKVSLSWGAVTGAASYEIFRCTVKSGVCTYGTTAFKTTTTNSYSYAASKTVYGYKVRAVNTVGKSNFSNEVRL